jgi:mannose-6-phosphate isomerase-like protein (cupin superfamily)
MIMYEKLVFALPQEFNEVVAEGDDPGYVIKPQAYFRGASQIPGAQYNVGFQIFVKPFFLDRDPHRHSVDEYLIFLGGTFPNVFDFDANIEFTLGQLGVDAEVYSVTKPTIIRVPAGVYHCPLNFKSVNKPVFFQAALMQDMFGGIYDTKDGPKELKYNGPVPCKYNANKKCDSCGVCLKEDWKPA